MELYCNELRRYPFAVLLLVITIIDGRDNFESRAFFIRANDVPSIRINMVNLIFLKDKNVCICSNWAVYRHPWWTTGKYEKCIILVSNEVEVPFYTSCIW